jgi:predicted ATPase
MLELQKFFFNAPIEKTADTVLFFDEPESHISLKNRKKLITLFTNFLEAHENTQIFAATHEPLFTQIPQSMIINFDTHPTTSIPSEEFDIHEYINK